MIIGIIAGVIALPLVISHYCFQTRIKNVFENKDCTERDLDERDYLLYRNNTVSQFVLENESERKIRDSE
jgi:hypothetical protein